MVKGKVRRQESWLQQKRLKSKARLQERHARRREEARDPELRAERLAKNKPITLEDKRIWPGAEKRKQKDEVEEEEDEEEEEEQPFPNKQDQDGEDDDDDDWLNRESDEEAEDEDSRKKRKGAKRRKVASEEPDASEEADASASDLPDKFANLLPDPPLAEPKILITTSRHSTLHRQAQTLVDLFPNSTYIPRSAHRYSHEYSVSEIAHFAANRGYTALVLLMEDQKRPYGLGVAMLPAGPMLHFSVKTWVDGKVLPNHGNSTGHAPELLLNNFATPLGRLVAGVVQRLFPAKPALVGRQVVTAHNMRDFVFVRRFRYAMRDKRPTEHAATGPDGKPMAGVEDVKVALQEIGPRITLKLRRVDKGIQRRSGQEWEWTGRTDKVRTSFQL